jgi:hypothetical protein
VGGARLAGNSTYVGAVVKWNARVARRRQLRRAKVRLCLASTRSRRRLAIAIARASVDVSKRQVHDENSSARSAMLKRRFVSDSSRQNSALAVRRRMVCCVPVHHMEQVRTSLKGAHHARRSLMEHPTGNMTKEMAFKFEIDNKVDMRLVAEIRECPLVGQVLERPTLDCLDRDLFRSV